MWTGEATIRRRDPASPSVRAMFLPVAILVGIGSAPASQCLDAPARVFHLRFEA
ncbi:MAG: hypothetical protein VX672_06855 [Planctomycetota bacterium]|nr:hypothetical protein [Planctomycetota bacterium]